VDAGVTENDREAEAMRAPATIRSRDGVSLIRHGWNEGQFVDDYIDDRIDRWRQRGGQVP
jgi:hypothetical protein